jgi:hypothetical protein
MHFSTPPRSYDKSPVVQNRNPSIVTRELGAAPENALVRYPAIVAFVLALASLARAAEPLDIRIGYLRLTESRTTISLIDLPPADDGLAGAQLAVADNNTAGKFLNQRFSLEDVPLKGADDPAAAVAALVRRGVSIVIADLPAEALLKAADAGRELLFFNAGAIDDRLREQDCRAEAISQQ